MSNRQERPEVHEDGKFKISFHSRPPRYYDAEQRGGPGDELRRNDFGRNLRAEYHNQHRTVLLKDGVCGTEASILHILEKITPTETPVRIALVATKYRHTELKKTILWSLGRRKISAEVHLLTPEILCYQSPEKTNPYHINVDVYILLEEPLSSMVSKIRKRDAVLTPWAFPSRARTGMPILHTPQVYIIAPVSAIMFNLLPIHRSLFREGQKYKHRVDIMSAFFEKKNFGNVEVPVPIFTERALQDPLIKMARDFSNRPNESPAVLILESPRNEIDPVTSEQLNSLNPLTREYYETTKPAPNPQKDLVDQRIAEAFNASQRGHKEILELVKTLYKTKGHPQATLDRIKGISETCLLDGVNSIADLMKNEDEQ